MEYFKVIIKDKLPEIRKWAAFNLPCFYFHFKNCSEENAKFFDDLYLELCTDFNTSEEILKCLASGIHEATKRVPTDQSLCSLKQCLDILMQSEYKSVRNAFCYNIDIIIKYYCKDKDFKPFYEQLLQNSNT